MSVSKYLFLNEPSRLSSTDIDQLLIHCKALSASDITFQTGEKVFAECYGKLYPVTQRKLSNTEVTEILNHIYGANGSAQILSGMDIDTHYECRPDRLKRYRFRVNGTGCLVDGHDGIQITLRSIPTTPPLLEDLSLEPLLVKALTPNQGVIYVTGSTGSGKSTLLAAIMRHLLEQTDSDRKIITYESPIEFVYDAIEKPSAIISQVEIPRHLPSFVAGVRNALRRKPHAILVGEARDLETIKAVIEAALTGHPVYTTLHSSGVTETIRRLIAGFSLEDSKGPIIDIIETVRVIVWQQLVPTITGEQIALREFLIFNDFIRNKLLEAPIKKMTTLIRDLLHQYGQPMIVDAEKKFKAGIISEQQFKRLSLSSYGISEGINQ